MVSNLRELHVVDILLAGMGPVVRDKDELERLV